MDVPLSASLQIRPIRADEIEPAKHLILSVAQPIYSPNESLEAFSEPFLSDASFFADIDAYATEYGPPDGLFLVVTRQRPIDRHGSHTSTGRASGRIEAHVAA